MFMVNKKEALNVKTGAKAPVFFLLRRICLFVCCMLLIQGKTNAQNPSAYYVSSMQSTGILYFVRPQTYFRNLNTNADLIMDVTYLNSRDSATINFSYFDRENINLETINISYDSWQYQTDVKRIFVEMKKKQWHYRYTFDIPFEQLELFYKTNAPVISLAAGSRTINIQPIRRWRKNSEINNLIIQIIQKNKTSIER